MSQQKHLQGDDLPCDATGRGTGLQCFFGEFAPPELHQESFVCAQVEPAWPRWCSKGSFLCNPRGQFCIFVASPLEHGDCLPPCRLSRVLPGGGAPGVL